MLNSLRLYIRCVMFSFCVCFRSVVPSGWRQRVCPTAPFHPGPSVLPLRPWGNVRTYRPLITTLGPSTSLPSVPSSLGPIQPWARKSLAVSSQWMYVGSPHIGQYAANCGAQISVAPPGWTYCWTCHRPALRPSFATPGTLMTGHSMFLLRRTTSWRFTDIQWHRAQTVSVGRWATPGASMFGGFTGRPDREAPTLSWVWPLLKHRYTQWATQPWWAQTLSPGAGTWVGTDSTMTERTDPFPRQHPHTPVSWRQTSHLCFQTLWQ